MPATQTAIPAFPKHWTAEQVAQARALIAENPAWEATLLRPIPMSDVPEPSFTRWGSSGLGH